MGKAASPTSKRATTAKKAAPPTSTRSRTAKSAEPPQDVAPVMVLEALAPLSQRLDVLEEKITNGLSALSAEVHTLAAAASKNAEGDAPTETFLPIVADLIRRSLMEHLTPVTAALKRVEERVGFIGNRLKHPAGGQERQRPWRHEPPRHARPKPHPAPRPGPGQPWTPPSAASVQGRFAPRPLHGGNEQVEAEEE